MLITVRKRTGLWCLCEFDGRRRVTVRQERTDRGVPPSSDRLAVDGLVAARTLVNAIDAARFGMAHEAAPEQEQDLDGSQGPDLTRLMTCSPSSTARALRLR